MYIYIYYTCIGKPSEIKFEFTSSGFQLLWDTSVVYRILVSHKRTFRNLGRERHGEKEETWRDREKEREKERVRERERLSERERERVRERERE